jgi:hypothetical protein
VGAWGISAFENDTAQDWVIPITRSRVRQRVGAALKRVERPGAVDSDVASVGLAACELVASASGHPHDSEPESLVRAVYGLSQGDLGDLREAALSCVERIGGPESELADLWDESDSDGDWRAYIADLMKRLQSSVTPLAPPPKAERQRRSKLGDVYEVSDNDLGYGYFQFVARTKNADVVLILREWHSDKQDLSNLEPLFGRWVRSGYLDRTWLPPEDDEGCTLFGHHGDSARGPGAGMDAGDDGLDHPRLLRSGALEERVRRRGVLSTTPRYF